MVENPFWVFELSLPLFFLSYQTSPLVTTVVLGRTWVTGDMREPLDEASITSLVKMLDEELRRRMPHNEQLVVDPEVLRIAIPLSEKNKGSGFAIMPRGSTMHVDDGLLRFFVYWKQTSRRTDYDLSALILNDRFGIATAPGVNHQQQMLANQFVIAIDGITAQWQAIRTETLHLLKDSTTFQLTTLTKHLHHASEDTQRVASEMLQLLVFEIPFWEGGL